VEDGAVFDSHGVRLGPLPAGAAPPSYRLSALTKVFVGRADAVAWVCDIAAAPDGRATIVFSVQRGGAGARARRGAGGHDLRYHYAHFDGQAWTEFEIARAGSCLYRGEDDYSGLVAVNPHNLSQVALSSNDRSVGEAPRQSDADGERRYRVYLGEVDTSTRSVRLWAPMPESGEDQIRPMFSRGTEGARNVLLWMAGAYRSYTDFRTRVVGFRLTEGVSAPPA
jgi:hypothetical protein